METHESRVAEEPDPSRLPIWSRQRYPGSFILNLGAFFLPALYNTLSKLWVANIDSSQVVLTDVYAYIGIVAEVLNDTFPRSAWHVIGDNSSRSVRSRFNLGYTLMIATATQGFVLMIVFVAYPQSLASAFVPEEVRGISLTYVRLSSVQFLTSATEAALSSSTRALDNPDVPLIFSSAKFVINIMLDFLVISKFHVTKQNPTIVSQAVVRLICDFVSVVAGLLYFSLIVARKLKIEPDGGERLNIGVSAFMTLLKPSVYTFTESAIRNAIYLWLVNRIVQMGETYATAWGVFNTIRWGLVMVPVQALESSTLAFVGHAWGSFRASAVTNHPRASRKDILKILRPALLSCVIVLVFEAVLCITLSVRGIEGFAYYLSNSRDVAAITQKMWRAIDWTYIFYGLNYQLAAVLLAASPRWFLYQALGSNFLWMLPWAIVMTKESLAKSQAWSYYAIIFGGAMVFDFFDVSLTLLLWMYRLSRGRVKV